MTEHAETTGEVLARSFDRLESKLDQLVFDVRAITKWIDKPVLNRYVENVKVKCLCGWAYETVICHKCPKCGVEGK